MATLKELIELDTELRGLVDDTINEFKALKNEETSRIWIALNCVDRVLEQPNVVKKELAEIIEEETGFKASYVKSAHGARIFLFKKGYPRRGEAQRIDHLIEFRKYWKRLEEEAKYKVLAEAQRLLEERRFEDAKDLLEMEAPKAKTTKPKISINFSVTKEQLDLWKALKNDARREDLVARLNKQLVSVLDDIIETQAKAKEAA